MKKLLFAILTMAIMLALVACNEGIVSVDIEIMNAAGAGTKTFDVRILKDSAEKPLEPGNIAEDNSKYLIGSIDDTVAMLQGICPLDDATIEIGETTDDYDTIIFSYSWANIDEYNEKTGKLAIEGSEIAAADITIDGDKLTFYEPAANQKNSIMWALKALNEDPELFNPKVGDVTVTPDDMAQIYDVTLTVGDTTETFRYTKTEDGTEIAENPDLSATGTVDAVGEEPTGEEPTNEDPTDEDESPKTGDYGIFTFVIMLFIAGSLLVAKKRVFNK